MITPKASHPSKQWAYDLVDQAARGVYRSRSQLPLQWAREVVARDGRANCIEIPEPRVIHPEQGLPQP